MRIILSIGTRDFTVNTKDNRLELILFNSDYTIRFTPEAVERICVASISQPESLEYEDGPEQECGQHAGLVRYYGDKCPMCRAMDLLHRSKQNIEACMQNIPFKEVGATPYTPPLIEEIEEFLS